MTKSHHFSDIQFVVFNFVVWQRVNTSTHTKHCGKKTEDTAHSLQFSLCNNNILAGLREDEILIKNVYMYWIGLGFYYIFTNLPPEWREDLVFDSLPDDQILDSSKLKEFADDNFKFDKIGRKLSKQVENTVGKGEIARYEQFLLFPQCFQQACFPGASKSVIVWEWVNSLPNYIFMDWSKLKAFADNKINTTEK